MYEFLIINLESHLISCSLFAKSDVIIQAIQSISKGRLVLYTDTMGFRTHYVQVTKCLPDNKCKQNPNQTILKKLFDLRGHTFTSESVPTKSSTTNAGIRTVAVGTISVFITRYGIQ